MVILDKIAADLQITDRSVSGSKAPVGPGTARDLIAAGRYGSAAQKMGTVLQAVGSGAMHIGSIVAGHYFGGLEGSMMGSAAVDALGAARKTATGSVAAQRQAEITRLIQGAIEDPQAARLLLAKTTPGNLPTLAQKVSGRLAQIAVTRAASQQGASP